MTQSNLIGHAIARSDPEASGVAFRNFKASEPGAAVSSIAVGELNMSRLADYLECLIGDLALEFSNKLRSDIGPDILRVIHRNGKEPFLTSCHSHDFCDANEPMAQAFNEVMGREVNLQSDFDTWIWGLAWSVAKQKKFFIPDSEIPRLGPTSALEKELHRRGLTGRKDPWHGGDGWYAAYYTLNRKGEKPKTVLVTAAAVTGQWCVEILEHKSAFKFNDETRDEIDEATD